jgi:hypothetical protein
VKALPRRLRDSWRLVKGDYDGLAKALVQRSKIACESCGAWQPGNIDSSQNAGFGAFGSYVPCAARRLGVAGRAP